MPRAVAFLLMLVFGAGLGWAQTSPGKGDEVDAKRAQQLEHLVRQDCGSCHGMTLKGGLGPDIRAATLEGRDPEALTQIILDGVPGTPMPPWRPLITEMEARWIAVYLIRGGPQ